MPTYENMYYYLEHSIREALQDLEQQNFGAAKKTLTQAREVTEKMRRVICSATRFLRNSDRIIEKK